jgi:hypothetical protein
VSALKTATDVTQITLEKRLGETLIAGNEAPAWKWPSR